MTQPEDKTRDIETVVMLAADALRECPAVRFAYLFGSLAMGTARPFSDVDIAAYLEKSVDFIEERLNLLERLTDRLGTDRVDVVALNTAPLPLRARVIRCNRLLVDREPFGRHAFESMVLREYFDFSRLEESILRRRFGVG